MIIIEYQLTARELVFIEAWRDLKNPFTIISLLLFLIGEAFTVKTGELPYPFIPPIFFLVLSFLRLWNIYRTIKANTTLTLRTKLSIGETGILVISALSKSERAWQSLRSWSESKNYFYLYFGNSYMIIPKRAFTDKQMEEFRKHAKNIYAPQSLQTLYQAEVSMGQKDKLISKVFLSYAREDFNTALRLFNDLRKAGIDVWLDREVLLPGQNWKAAIRQAIRESRFFLALLSNNSVSKKGYVQKELKHAIEALEEYPESAIFIIPIRLDDCNPTTEQLQELHWIDIFEDWEGGLVRIISTIQSQSPIQSATPNNSFNRSGVRLPPIRKT
jgi:hypothetical protein